jgi:hypothetical protein
MRHEWHWGNAAEEADVKMDSLCEEHLEKQVFQHLLEMCSYVPRCKSKRRKPAAQTSRQRLVLKCTQHQPVGAAGRQISI